MTECTHNLRSRGFIVPKDPRDERKRIRAIEVNGKSRNGKNGNERPGNGEQFEIKGAICVSANPLRVSSLSLSLSSPLYSGTQIEHGMLKGRFSKE